MPRGRKRQPTFDYETALRAMAESYAQYFSLEPEDGIEQKVEILDESIKNQFPREFKKMERIATNMALGHRE